VLEKREKLSWAEGGRMSHLTMGRRTLIGRNLEGWFCEGALYF
jgi:hypothetical protein